jgi:AcrR family transcriptional regulator
MPKKPKKPYHHGDLADGLVAAAEQALSELPLEQVTLREIARRAGVSHAAPKHHFGSLGVLLAEVAARGHDRFVAALGEAADKSPNQSARARLAAMGHAYIGFATTQPAVYGLMFGKKEALEFTPRLVAAMTAAWTQLETEVQNIVGTTRATETAAYVWSTVHGLAMLIIDRRLPPHVDKQVIVDGVIEKMMANFSR